MTRPEIRALVEDGPRAGETFMVDAESDNAPPREILLPNGRGGRSDDGRVAHPTGAVSTYRFVGADDDRSGYVYKVVPHGE